MFDSSKLTSWCYVLQKHSIWSCHDPVDVFRNKCSQESLHTEICGSGPLGLVTSFSNPSMGETPGSCFWLASSLRCTCKNALTQTCKFQNGLVMELKHWQIDLWIAKYIKDKPLKVEKGHLKKWVFNQLDKPSFQPVSIKHSLSHLSTGHHAVPGRDAAGKPSTLTDKAAEAKPGGFQWGEMMLLPNSSERNEGQIKQKERKKSMMRAEWQWVKHGSC